MAPRRRIEELGPRNGLAIVERDVTSAAVDRDHFPRQHFDNIVLLHVTPGKMAAPTSTP
jgi:hypothetical protein